MPVYGSIRDKKLVTKAQIEDLLKSRDVEQIEVLKNKVFSRKFVLDSYEVREHVWSHGDRLYKLADEHYGNSKLFWIIGLYNNKPTDAHWNYGDIVYIPIDYIKVINNVEE